VASSIYWTGRNVRATGEWQKSPWDDDRIRAIVGDGAKRNLDVGESDFLVYRDNRTTLLPAKAWLLTPAVKALEKEAVPSDTTLTALEQQPFWAVFKTTEFASGRKKRTLRAHMGVYERSTATLVCETSFDVDSTSGKGQSPPPRSVQRAFKAKAREKLSGISKVLQIYDEPKDTAARAHTSRRGSRARR